MVEGQLVPGPGQEGDPGDSPEGQGEPSGVSPVEHILVEERILAGEHIPVEVDNLVGALGSLVGALDSPAEELDSPAEELDNPAVEGSLAGVEDSPVDQGQQEH